MSSPTSSYCTLSLHDALPISFSLFQASAYRETGFIQQIDLALVQLLKTSPHRAVALNGNSCQIRLPARQQSEEGLILLDRKSTRLNSSHVATSYAVFCLKKKI